METRLEAGEEVPESRPASSKMRLSMSMEEAAGACGSGDGAITSFEVIVILTLFVSYELTTFFSRFSTKSGLFFAFNCAFSITTQSRRQSSVASQITLLYVIVVVCLKKNFISTN